MNKNKYLTFSALILLLILFISLAFGSINIFSESISTDTLVKILKIRAAHVTLVICIGGLLALSGTILQALLKNSLADPYILGTSSASALGAMLAISLDLDKEIFFLLPFVCAMLNVLVLLKFSLEKTIEQVILIGIAISAMLNSVIIFGLNILPPIKSKNLYFWLIGDISTTCLNIFPLIILILGTIISFILSRELNMLSMGENKAIGLGVDIKKLRFISLTLTALLTATAVSYAGSLGFIGLIVPHFLRILNINTYEYLIPLSVIVGAIFLLSADILSRTILAPMLIPTGAVTAIIGAPIFLYLLSRSNK